MRVFVIGGINMDITGIPGMKLKQGDSNPGRVTMLPGGIARNIAENLVRMGVQVELVAAFGDDLFSKELKENCEKIGIGVAYSVFAVGRSGLYVSVADEKGSVYSSVADLDILEELTQEHIAGILDEINSADACIIEANLGIDVIEYVANHVTVPIFADPVSISKSEKVKGILPKLYAIKPNKPEAATLAGIEISDPASLLVAAEILVEKGVKQAFVSLGPDGMVYADGKGVGIVPASRVHVENRTGVGDSATAALCFAYLRGMDACDSAVLACKAAGLTLQSDTRVCQDIERIATGEMEEEAFPEDIYDF